MKKLYTYMLIATTMLGTTACSDFLETVPKDALSPAIAWNSESDAMKFVTGCYDGWGPSGQIYYMDCASDIAYNNFPWEEFKDLGNGSMTTANPGKSFYDFKLVRRCNTFLENVERVKFVNEADKKDAIAQVRAIRAYQYFKMSWWYGGVPIIDNYEIAEEAQVPAKTEAQVRTYVTDELDAAIADLKVDNQRGRFTKGAALALRMRAALYYGDYATAKAKAQEIIDLNKYSLDPSYENLFTVAGQGSPEIILAVQQLAVTKGDGTVGQMYNNGEGGWSSIVLTKNLIDMYEMADGLTKEEAGANYDPTHPFNNRDPRMDMTVLYPGCDYPDVDGNIAVFNTLDKQIAGQNNPNYMTIADNASKTGLTWKKYLYPMSQYGDIWDTNACPIVFRYAEVLLTYAEAANELDGPSADVYAKINAVRTRAGMPAVDENKYKTKAKLRELIRRERGVEFAGEGLRRADIVRWQDDAGKMVAETVLNGALERFVGTVSNEGPEGLRATINSNASTTEKLIENRSFKAYNRYFPLPQSALDKNKYLKSTPGY